MDEYLALCVACRDIREEQAVQLEPGVFDIMYLSQQWYRKTFGRETHHVITSAYRTPNTNKRIGGATHSAHMTGRALDGYMAGLDLEAYASLLRQVGAGGVGLYSRHVHWDVGRAATFWRGSYVENT